MDVRELRTLVAVVRLGSFTAAAEELGYTQSAVSQQIAALEREAGCPLVTRRPVRPTPAGERLAGHAERILLRLDIARTELGRLVRRPHLARLAAAPLAGPAVVAGALRLLRATDPALTVEVRSVAPAEVVTRVATGEVDAGLVDGITGPGEPLHLVEAGLLATDPVAEQAVVVALAASHPLARRSALPLDALGDAPWIVADQLTGHHRGWAAVAPARPGTRVVYAGLDLHGLLHLVAAGLGATVLPADAAALHPGVVGVPLSTPALVHRTELVTLRTEARTDSPVGAALRRAAGG